MRIFWITLGLLLWGWGTLLGQSVTVHGQKTGYGGKTIQVSSNRNPFITTPREIENLVCDERGNFDYSTEVDAGGVILFETGIYRAYLYVEPGFHYEVEMPAYQEKAYAERISPFYQPVEVPVNVLSRSTPGTGVIDDQKSDINFMISRFDPLFSVANEGVILNRRMGRDSDVDSIMGTIELNFVNDTARFFVDYRKYKYGVLKLNEGKTGLEQISIHYLGPEVRFSHPGFMELFNAMYSEFIYYYSRTPPGKRLLNHINRTHDLDSIRSILGKHPAVWNDTVADMILLQEMSSLFYAGDFHKEAILILLDSLESNPVSPAFAIYAAQLKDKLSSLLTGHPPPGFALPDLEGNTCTPGDFMGKYIYLMFCTPDHYGCMMEYPYLQSFLLRHSEYLEVLTVMVAEEESQVKDFMQRNGYGWKALFYEGQPGILSDYLIKAFPTAYLIGPDGNLLLSPSPLPSDGFEQQLFRIMRSRGDI